MLNSCKLFARDNVVCCFRKKTNKRVKQSVFSLLPRGTMESPGTFQLLPSMEAPGRRKANRNKKTCFHLPLFGSFTWMIMTQLTVFFLFCFNAFMWSLNCTLIRCYFNVLLLALYEFVSIAVVYDLYGCIWGISVCSLLLFHLLCVNFEVIGFTHCVAVQILVYSVLCGSNVNNYFACRSKITTTVCSAAFVLL